MSFVVNRQLGFLSPTTVSITGRAVTSGLSWWDKQKVQRLVPDFPGIFERAVVDFVKFKTGVARGLFTDQQQAEVMAWYLEFPELWETIRLNFIKTDEGLEFGGRVDDFIGRLRKSEVYRSSTLGLAPAIIAGIVIAGGVAAGLWAVSFVQRQANVSKMIDRVTAGSLPPEVLVEAMKAEQSSGLFAGIGHIGRTIAFAAAAWLVYTFTRKR